MMGVKTLFLSILLLLSSGCLYQKKTILKKIDAKEVTPSFVQTKNNVTLEVTNIDSNCKKFLGKDLRPAKIHTLLFTIKNNNEEVVCLKTQDIDLKMQDPQKVLNKLSTATPIKLLSESLIYTGFLTFIAVPIIAASALIVTTGVMLNTLLPIAYVANSALIGLSCACLVFMGPYLIIDSGLSSSQNNEQIRTTFEKSTLISNNKVTIQPSSYISFVVFVQKKNYKNNFKLSLKNNSDQNFDFEVKL